MQQVKEEKFIIPLGECKRKYFFNVNELTADRDRANIPKIMTPKIKNDNSRSKDYKEILWNYILDNAVNGIYTKESGVIISKNLNGQIGKTKVNEVFKEFVELGWLTEVETNKQYNLTRTSS